MYVALFFISLLKVTKMASDGKKSFAFCSEEMALYIEAKQAVHNKWDEIYHYMIENDKN